MITPRDLLLHIIESSDLDEEKKITLRRLVRHMPHPDLDALCELFDWLDSETEAE